jgi:hypothetical protein
MLENRTWVSENTEVYTPGGWVPIKNLRFIKSCLGVKKNKIVETIVTEYNSYYLDGMLPYSKSKHFLQGKILYPEDCLWQPDICLEIPKTRSNKYKGKLYNIVTTTNNLFIRTVFDGEDNFDYTLILCAK